MKPILDVGKDFLTKNDVGVAAFSPDGNAFDYQDVDQAMLSIIMVFQSTSPAGGAIDNKIEQAMDLVKSHLLFAVREEVEVLKEQIKILVEKNDMLQEENASLKQRLSAAPPQGNPTSGLATITPSHQGMPIQNPTQDQTQYPGMQNLGQTPMGQALSDHAAYPQHPRPTQQTHSTPNPGGLADTKPQYTPQTSVESQGGYHTHSQLHVQGGQGQQQHLPQGIQDSRTQQYSQVAATNPPQPSSQATPQQTQQQYHTAPGAAGSRPNATH